MAQAVIRAIGGFIADVTVKETHKDDLTITTHPVERGAAITDHAFKNPAQLTVQAGTKGAGLSLSDAYASLLDLQASAELLEVQTGKRLYQNMLIRSLAVETDAATENVLMITAQLQEVILVETLETAMPKNAVRQAPQSASGVANTGSKRVSSYFGATPSI